jgi:hypothetical protein
VVRQKYEVQVYDEYVISGNTAVLRCQVPSYVADYVMVTSWIQDGSVNIYPNTDTGKRACTEFVSWAYNVLQSAYVVLKWTERLSIEISRPAKSLRHSLYKFWGVIVSGNH